jgi:hypothetical protein
LAFSMLRRSSSVKETVVRVIIAGDLAITESVIPHPRGAVNTLDIPNIREFGLFCYCTLEADDDVAQTNSRRCKSPRASASEGGAGGHIHHLPRTGGVAGTEFGAGEALNVKADQSFSPSANATSVPYPTSCVGRLVLRHRLPFCPKPSVRLLQCQLHLVVLRIPIVHCERR